jgi:threonine dehydrogenase-like Zn-dependent dehydrogenase
VAEVGDHVRTLRVGDRVLVSGVVGCGECGPCLSGRPNLCLKGEAKAFGTVPDLPGGQAEALAVPCADSFALPIPEGVSDEEAVLLTDILPTGYVGASRAAIAPGSTVVVVGLGPVGVMAVQCASLFGPARILAVDMVPERLARAEGLGAEPVDARRGPVPQQVLEATGGRGAESVIEAVGADATVLDAVSCAATGGTVSVVGVNLKMDLPFPMALVLLKSLTVRAVFCPIPGTWQALVPLIRAGRFPGLAETFTHRIGLSRAAEAYELFDSRDDGVLKVLLDPKS